MRFLESRDKIIIVRIDSILENRQGLDSLIVSLRNLRGYTER